MASPILALLERSLRIESRLKVTATARVMLVSVVALFLLFAVLSTGWAGAPGLSAFTAIVRIQLVFITLASFGYFSSAITEEKEEETLGLLRMTDLNPLAILLGKSTSRLLGALLLLLAQLPFTFLAATLGGISTRQILACYAALGGYTFFLGNLALLASVRSSRTGIAALLVATVLGLLVGARTVATLVSSTFTFADPFCAGVFGILSEALAATSTFQHLTRILATGFNGSILAMPLAVDLMAGAVCFLLAWASFDRCCGARSEEGRIVADLSTSRRKGFDAGRVWKNAILWKDAHFIHGGRSVMWLKLIVYGLAATVFATAQIAGTGPMPVAFYSSVAFQCGLLAVSVMVLELAFAASRMFAVELREKTLASLALLPIPLPRLHALKVSSCAPAGLPAAVFAALGLSLGLAGALVERWNGLSSFLLSLGLSSLGLLYCVPQAMLLFHLTARLSLRFPRAALPLAVAIVLIANLGAIFLTCGFGILAMPFVAFIAAEGYRSELVQRLEKMVAEE